MDGARWRTALVLAVVVLAATVSAAATLARATAPSSLAGALITPRSADRGGLAVDPLPGAAGALRTGDLVVAIDGRPVVAWADRAVANGPLVRWSVGDVVPLDVLRGGGREQVAVRLAVYPVASVLLASAGTLAFCVLLFGVGAFVMWRRPRDPAAGALLVTGTGALGSTVPFLLGADPLDLATGLWQLHAAAIVGVYLLLWAGAIHFALVFPRPLGVLRRRRILELAPYLAVYGGYLASLAVSAATARDTLAWLATWGPLQLVIVLSTFVLTVGIGAWHWRIGDTADRRLLRASLAATIFVTSVNLLVWVIPELLVGRALLPWSVAGLIGLPVPLALGAAILRHRAFDIDVVVRRSMLWGGLTAGVVVAYAIAVAVLGAVFRTEGSFAANLLATGIAAVAVLPLRDVLQRVIDRGLYGDRREPVRAIRRLGERLEWTLGVEAIPAVVVETVAEALRLPYVALELGGPGEPGGTRLAAQRGSAPAHPVALPLVHGGREVGRLLVAPREGDDSLTPADLVLVADLARQVGVAAHAILLAEDLRRSRERIVAAREEERKRLRRDLHDGLGPALAAIAMRADVAATLVRTDADGTEHALLELGAEVRQLVGDVRRLVDGLRPPALDELGLVGALRREAERLTADGREFTVDAAEPLGPLPAAVEVAAFRIGAEAMTNAARHAAATRCLVRIRRDGDLTLEVVDDGRGLSRARRDGVGLDSMRERAAELGGDCRIDRLQERGTRVVARLPLALVGLGPEPQRGALQ